MSSRFRAGAALRVALLVLAGGCATARTAAADSRPLLVIPQDGRGSQDVAVVSEGTGSFVPLIPLARALGVRFGWNPFTYRGWIATDSTRVHFMMGSEIVTHGLDARQLSVPFGYAEEGPLVPIELLELLADPWSAGRRARWQPRARRLDWGSASPPVQRVRLSQIGHQATLRVETGGPARARVYWSPAGTLDVVLDGCGFHPDSVRGGADRGTLVLRRLEGWPNGCRLTVGVDPTAVGASIRSLDREGAWELVATASREEAIRGGFRMLEKTDRSLSLASGPVLLACIADPALDPSEGIAALRDLADRVALTLSHQLGLEAVVLEETDAIDLAAKANEYGARCLLGLRIDRYRSGLGAIQVWTGVARSTWIDLERAPTGPVEGTRPILWSETPLLHREESAKLAATLVSHLGALSEEGEVCGGTRPSRWLEGLAMSAALVYPAMGDDPASLDRLLHPDRREQIARAIAFGISEALIPPEQEPRLW